MHTINTYPLSLVVVLMIFILGIVPNDVKAQDPIFSQFYSTPLQLNPAFAGNTHAPLINIAYRNQWSAWSPSAYSTYMVSYDQFVSGLNSGFGVMALSDDAGGGLYKTNRFTGIFSYRLEINRDLFLKFGIEAGAIQTRIDWDRYQFYDQIDQINGFVNEFGVPYVTDEVAPEELTKTILDVSTGLLVYSSKFYGGITLKHINTPDNNYLGINDNLNAGYPLRFTAQAGMQITLQEGNKRKMSSFISPNIMYIRQRDFAQLNVGAYARLGAVFAGVWYRQAFTNPDAAIFLAGVHKGILKIGYSYDLTVSSPLDQYGSGGSHEISLTINFDANRPRKQDYNDCFQMFR